MKNLDLDKYGVQEMNMGEMQKTEGGIMFTLCMIGAIASLHLVGYMVYKSVAGAYQYGYDLGRNSQK